MIPLDRGILGPLSGQVVLGAGGYGAIRFAPAGRTWDITNVSVVCSSNVNEATATVYRNQIGSLYRYSGTYAGSSGDNDQMDVPLHLEDGEAMYVVWEGGDVGATATAVISGFQTVPEIGFRTRV